ncbi:hypothetical protein GCM10019016_089380 [Streptomyces prasinosporus]|uniref:Uncharacterized protein n=1 Tax=Streptomyces prasinosporus TaxID=68256 RepID=A0ABP6U2D2_9ACTN
MFSSQCPNERTRAGTAVTAVVPDTGSRPASSVTTGALFPGASVPAPVRREGSSHDPCIVKQVREACMAE